MWRVMQRLQFRSDLPPSLPLTVSKWVLRADVERTSLIADEARLTALIIQNETEKGAQPLPADLVGVNLEVALQEVYERMDAIGVNSAEGRAIKILTGLGFEREVMSSTPTQALSGGWAMRAALAAALFVKPDFLLLDEVSRLSSPLSLMTSPLLFQPTNHLDLHALVWLEAYLKHGFQGIALIVSHDEYFLDEVCTDILEMRSPLAGAKKGSLTHFSGFPPFSLSLSLSLSHLALSLLRRLSHLPIHS
jgi:ATPase subunit of ABC transporter with duplicated ATPase domains